MHKPKVLVVEDEIIIADNMCDALNDLGFEALEPALSYTEAIAFIEEDNPDIAILDIHLSGKKSGIDVAKFIKEKYDFPFIFLTSYSDKATVNEVKSLNPAAFLVKPFSKEELFTSIEIALSNFSLKPRKESNKEFIVKDAFFIKDKGGLKKIQFNDIMFIKSEHVYVEIELFAMKKILYRSSLNKIIDSLNDNFIRVHRSYIVNTKYLKEIGMSSLRIENNLIPIGKKYRQEIISKLNIL